MLRPLVATAAILAALSGGASAQTETGTTVDQATLEEIRQTADKAFKAAEAAAAKPPKTEEAIAAQKQAIQSHRDSLFARINERQQ